MSRGKFIGQLIFEPDGTPLLADNVVNQGTFVNPYYRLENFQNCIDLLRNEGPVYLFFPGVDAGFEHGIQTTPEAVGEGELI
jgi:hypothetical protein